MPPNKKKNSTSKKKKGRGAPPATASRRAGRSATSSDGFGNLKNAPAPFLKKSSNASEKEKAASAAVGGLTHQYKRATSEFCEWLSAAGGRKLRGARVKDILLAAKDVYRAVQSVDGDNADGVFEIPKQVMDGLALTIRMREEAAAMMASGGRDRGHDYIIHVLKRCRRYLRWSRRIVYIRAKECKKAAASAKAPELVEETGEASLRNRFEALLSDYDEEEDEEEKEGIDDDMIRDGKYPEMEVEEARFASDANDDLRIEEDLIKGSDRFQAILYLNSMEFLMQSVDQHFGMLKRFMHGQDAHNSDSNVQLLLECSAATNLAINCVRSMEASLATDYEHLSSIYNVVAIVFLPNFIAAIEKEMKPKLRREKPDLTKIFCGDIVESAFHNNHKGETQRRIADRSKRFAKASGLDYSSVHEHANIIHHAMGLEAMLRIEENPQMNSMLSRFNQAPHSWLQRFNYNYIGGERCIFNTLKLVQMLMDVVEDKTKLVSKGGFFGKMWNERSYPAKQIRGDMDELLSGDILPELIEICKWAPFKQLPALKELLPLLDILSQAVSQRDKAVPFSLAFGLHATLTAIFVLQGDRDVERLAKSAKTSWDTLFAQLEEASNTNQSQPPNFFANVNMFKQLKNFAKPVSSPGSGTAEMHAFWNPTVGGSYLLFGTYICNIGLGSATVDAFGQLRFTLHLYNAFKESGILQGDNEFLSLVDNTFKDTKAIWVGGRPSKGNFMKKFLIAWGFSIEDAKQRVAEEQAMWSKGIRQTKKPPAAREKVRNLDEILPEQFSASYRRLVKNNFDGADGSYSVINETKEQKKKYGVLMDFVTNVNIVRDGMDDDEPFMPLNLTRVGVSMNSFVCELSDEMGWSQIIKALASSCPDEIRKSRNFNLKVPNAYESSDEALERQALVPMLASVFAELDFAPHSSEMKSSKKAAEFMTEYFKKFKEKMIFMKDEAL